MQISRAGGVTIVNDAYNANPSSVRAALDTLRGLPCAGRRVAVLGDMRELGDATERYHREIGEVAAAAGLDHLVTVGKQSRFIAASALIKGMPPAQVLSFDTAADAAAAAPEWVRDGDLVLIKASRGIRLEQVARAIEAALAPAARQPVEDQPRFFRRVG